jgi:hypothetical protein
VRARASDARFSVRSRCTRSVQPVAGTTISGANVVLPYPDARMDQYGGATGRVANLDGGTWMIAIGHKVDRGIVLGVMAAQRIGAGLDAPMIGFPNRAVVARSFPLDRHPGKSCDRLPIDEGINLAGHLEEGCEEVSVGAATVLIMIDLPGPLC